LLYILKEINHESGSKFFPGSELQKKTKSAKVMSYNSIARLKSARSLLDNLQLDRF